MPALFGYSLAFGPAVKSSLEHALSSQRSVLDPVSTSNAGVLWSRAGQHECHRGNGDEACGHHPGVVCSFGGWYVCMRVCAGTRCPTLRCEGGVTRLVVRKMHARMDVESFVGSSIDAKPHIDNARRRGSVTAIGPQARPAACSEFPAPLQGPNDAVGSQRTTQMLFSIHDPRWVYDTCCARQRHLLHAPCCHFSHITLRHGGNHEVSREAKKHLWFVWLSEWTGVWPMSCD